VKRSGPGYCDVTIVYLLADRVKEFWYRDLRKYLHNGGEHGECHVLVCTQEQDFFIITRIGNKYQMIGSQLTT